MLNYCIRISSERRSVSIWSWEFLSGILMSARSFITFCMVCTFLSLYSYFSCSSWLWVTTGWPIQELFDRLDLTSLWLYLKDCPWDITFDLEIVSIRYESGPSEPLTEFYWLCIRLAESLRAFSLFSTIVCFFRCALLKFSELICLWAFFESA